MLRQLAECGLAPRWRLIAVVKKQGDIGQSAGCIAPQFVGQGHLWCEQKNAFASGQTGLGKLKVDGGFATAGYTKQQTRGCRVLAQGFKHALKRRVLVVIKTEWGRRRGQQTLLGGINNIIVKAALARKVYVPGFKQGVQGRGNGLPQ